jgi:hypothetical protein
MVGSSIGVLAAAGLFDVIAPLNTVFRAVALAAVILSAGWALLAIVAGAIVRRISTVEVARHIEAQLPGIQNRLVTALELERTSGPTTAESPAFYYRLVDEAVERTRGFRARRVVGFQRLRRAAILSFAAAIAFNAAWLLLGDQFLTAVTRIVHPFEDIPPASGVRYSVVTPAGDAHVLRGDELAFTVDVSRGEPDDLQLELAGAGPLPVFYALRKRDSRLWELRVDTSSIGAGFEHAFTYRVKGGGTWTPMHKVTVVDRPAIAALQVLLHYPEYMGIAEPVHGDPEIHDVSGPEESRIEIIVDAEGDVSEAEIQLLDYGTMPFDPAARAERVWLEDRLPDGAAYGGTWQWDRDTDGKPMHTEPSQPAKHGHWFADAPAFRVEKGEKLFAYVRIDPGEKPEALMLQWHDGKNWEHRAYWGADRFDVGKPDSASRKFMGPLPPAGRWVRLEVPAGEVALEGQALRGMSFLLVGGGCCWQRAGALRVPERGLVPVQTIAMQKEEAGRWSGSFTLRGSGYYRAELRNELRYANRPMKEARFVAFSDAPPQVALERPGGDLTLKRPQMVPLLISAVDDFGLAEISLAIERKEGGPWQRQVVRSYDTPRLADTVEAMLDLTELQVHAGGWFRYRAEARDRKGQVSRTKEYTIRIMPDSDSAESQLAEIAKHQEPLRQMMDMLAGRQSQIAQSVIQSADHHRPSQPAATDKRSPPAAQDKKVDVRHELGWLNPAQQENAELGHRLAKEMRQTAEQAAQSPLVPKPLSEAMQELERRFRERDVPSLDNLSHQMEEASRMLINSKTLESMKEQNRNLQKDLDELQQRLASLRELEKQWRERPKEAAANLHRDKMEQEGREATAKLEEFRNRVASLREEIEQQRRDQEGLRESTARAPEPQLAKIEQQQSSLDKRQEQLMRRSRAYQQPGNASPNRRSQNRKDEQSGTPADKGKQAGAGKPGNGANGNPQSGNSAQPGQSAGNRETASQQSAGSDAGNTSGRRQSLEARQDRKLGELANAQRTLASNQQQLEQMLSELRQALNAGPRASGRSSQSSGAQQQLANLMKSEGLRQALAQLAHLQGGGQPGARVSRPISGGSSGGAPVFEGDFEAELGILDPNTRAALLRMQPKLREELLQSMHEEAPAGFHKLIENYFRRLTESKDDKRPGSTP